MARGLHWLALHQAPDGHWSLEQFNLHARKALASNRYFDDKSTGKGQKNDTAGTAFGLLPFLAAGITHKPAAGKKGKVDNKYVKTVAQGLNYLLGKQGRDGSFPDGMYTHGLATIAVCEAYGLTSDPKLKRSAQLALNYIVAAQDPVGGGWRYQPRQGSDTSVTGFQIAALKSGQLAGLNVPKATLQKAGKWLDFCQTKDKSGYGYIGSERPSITMTAVGLLCRMYLGTPREDPGLKAGAAKLKTEYLPKPQQDTSFEDSTVSVHVREAPPMVEKRQTG